MENEYPFTRAFEGEESQFLIHLNLEIPKDFPREMGVRKVEEKVLEILHSYSKENTEWQFLGNITCPLSEEI